MDEGGGGGEGLGLGTVESVIRRLKVCYYMVHEDSQSGQSEVVGISPEVDGSPFQTQLLS